MPDLVKVTRGRLSVDAAYRAVVRKDCGAVSLFVGTVRNSNDGRRVRRMRYSAFDAMARRELAGIIREARRNWRLGAVYIAHRTGTLQLGEPSVVIALSAPHRAEAFAACRFAIEHLKKSVPIWKEEFYARGKAWIAGEHAPPLPGRRPADERRRQDRRHVHQARR